MNLRFFINFSSKFLVLNEGAMFHLDFSAEDK